jgi:6-phosphogluconolactonase
MGPPVERGLGPELRVFPDLPAATSAAARHVRELAVAAVRARGRFSWVVAGGHTPEGLYARLATSYRARFPWAETEVYFGDERCVSPRSAESNYAMVRRSLLVRVPIPRGRVHRMAGEVRPPSTAAARYARRLGPVPSGTDPESAWFDVVLLGIGPDGHTASLFPGAPSLRERRRPVVAVPRSGQPPWVPRLTMTLPALAASREVLFLVAGPDKARALGQIFRAGPRGTRRWPASCVRSRGPVRWYVDRSAAGELPDSVRSA